MGLVSGVVQIDCPDYPGDVAQGFMDSILLGDCEEVLKNIPDGCVDLIFTSPPCADRLARSRRAPDTLPLPDLTPYVRIGVHNPKKEVM